MHACGDRIIELFSGRGGGMGGADSPVSLDSSLWNNPARLCYTVRQGLKEAAVASAKLLLLCDLFAKRKCQLSRQERHDIMKQAKSRMPIFLKQLHKFLLVLKHQSQMLTAQQRYDVASYLVPEVLVLCIFVVCLYTALTQWKFGSLSMMRKASCNRVALAGHDWYFP